MNDDRTVALTEKGQQAVRDIHERFAAGEAIEQIAASYSLDVAHVQLLVAIGEHFGVLD